MVSIIRILESTLCDHRVFLQQDNAGVHHRTSVRRITNRPVCSPDLNPTKTVWNGYQTIFIYWGEQFEVIVALHEVIFITWSSNLMETLESSMSKQILMFSTIAEGPLGSFLSLVCLFRDFLFHYVISWWTAFQNWLWSSRKVILNTLVRKEFLFWALHACMFSGSRILYSIWPKLSVYKILCKNDTNLPSPHRSLQFQQKPNRHPHNNQLTSVDVKKFQEF